MPDIPDQPVMRRIKDVMQADGQLDDAEPGAEMPARDRYRVDQFGAQLVRDLAQIGFRKPAQIRRRLDPVEKRRAVGDLAARLSVQGLSSSHSAVYDDRFTTNLATCRNSSARCSNMSRWATAWRTKSSAWARARSTPSIETNVALPAAASAPTGLPVCAAEPSTSSRSSAI